MSRTRKDRAGAAFAAGAEMVRSRPAPAPADERPSGGNWSRQAFRALEGDAEDARAEAAKANAVQYDGILEGVVPLRIPVDRIEDVVGTDRIVSGNVEDDAGHDADNFPALVENIRTRGLRVPIRVRALDPDWRPDPAFPRDLGEQRFALQSGRRRLAACRALGIDPLCFLSFVSADEARMDDLRERFFENSARKGLSPIEKFYSIGLIAQETEGATQQQVAEILGINISYVSRGMAVVQHFDQLSEMMDIRHCSREQIDQALREIRQASLSSHPEAERARNKRAASRIALPFRAREVPFGKIKLRTLKTGGRAMTIESEQLDDERIEKIMKILDDL